MHEALFLGAALGLAVAGGPAVPAPRLNTVHIEM